MILKWSTCLFAIFLNVSDARISSCAASSKKEYNAALTEDDLDTSRRTMKRLEAIAMQDYGLDYADELATKKEACKK